MEEDKAELTLTPDKESQMTVEKEVDGKPEYAFDVQTLGYLLKAMCTRKVEDLKRDTPISAFYAEDIRLNIPVMLDFKSENTPLMQT